uniref:non-specific serine/threonine protein kinase n=1 Tax=Ascaris lumbricoides TaxID=6252 RepID=A0A0M3HNL0_ASCLU
MSRVSTPHEILSSKTMKAPTVTPKTTWNVVRTLGEGAFGEVKLVVDSKNSNIAVAMKCIDLERHPDVIDAVRKEIRFLLLLLFHHLEPDVGMPSAKAQFYFRQLIEGVKFIHSIGIVHRDIKPENILLTQKDVLKISDFGMATVFKHNGQERMLSTRCGTLPYVSPQVLTGTYRAEPTDIWSCGVVLVALLAGELPWESPLPRTKAYMNWKESTTLDEHPWKKIGTVALALLRTILNDDEKTRATIERIENHPWYTADFIKHKGVLSRISSGKQYSPNHAVPLKRRRFELDVVNESCIQLADSISQPAARLPHYSLEEVLNNTRKTTDLTMMKGAFSQPENIEALLLNHSQIDESQRHCIDPLQLLVRRMTRFCVTVSVVEALRRIIEACESSGFEAKKRTSNQLAVSDRREMSFMVAIYEMANIGGRKRAAVGCCFIRRPLLLNDEELEHFCTHTIAAFAIKQVMVDFRRSRGDGIEFKRAFVVLKKKLGVIVCKEGTDWLEKHGLVCSQAFTQLTVQ